MASYHLSLKSGKKGQAAEHANYITREGKYSRNGKQVDLITTAYGNLPEWAHGNPTTFWKMSDKYERVNGAAYREYELALPWELTARQHMELIREFIQSVIADKPYQWAIHCPVAALGNVDQPHVHIMFSDRIPDWINRPPEQYFSRYNPSHPELGGCKKNSGGKDPATLSEDITSVREIWAKIQNAALERYGHIARVDHRSNESRGIERAPERHLGYVGIKGMSEEDKAKYNDRRQNNHHP